jgi:hypothetical protein
MRYLALGFLLALGCGSSAEASTTPNEQPGDTPTGAARDNPSDSLTPGNEPPVVVPEEWRCVAEPTLTEAPDPARVRYTVPIFDFNSKLTSPTAVRDLQVDVCSGSCEQTLQRCTTPEPSPDEQCYGVGEDVSPLVLAFDLPFAFSNGILRFSAPGYVALDYVLGGPMMGSPEGDMTVRGLPLSLFSEQSRALLYGEVGVSTVDPTRGMLLVRALNCLRQTGPLGGFEGTRAQDLGIEAMNVEAVAGAVGFSLSSDYIATPGAIRTEATGVGGFASVAPGAIGVRAQTPGGEITTTVRTRPNVITLAELRPGLDVWGQ